MTGCVSICRQSFTLVWRNLSPLRVASTLIGGIFWPFNGVFKVVVRLHNPTLELKVTGWLLDIILDILPDGRRQGSRSWRSKAAADRRHSCVPMDSHGVMNFDLTWGDWCVHNCNCCSGLDDLLDRSLVIWNKWNKKISKELNTFFPLHI